MPPSGFAREGATLVLLQAVEAHSSPFMDPTDAQVAVVREAEAYVATVAARARRTGGRTVRTAVWYSPPAESIVEAARCNHADLIVMTTHGRTGFSRLLLGSVAEGVLSATSTPILLLRPEAAAPSTVGVAEEKAHV
jgi:nucleotide-binding universal stress UspA family protein